MGGKYHAESVTYNPDYSLTIDQKILAVSKDFENKIEEEKKSFPFTIKEVK